MNDDLLNDLADDSLAVHADGDADFGGKVSSEEFTASGTATFAGRVFLGKTGRGAQVNHGSVSGDTTIGAHNGNVHYLTLSGDTNLGLERGSVGTAEMQGTTLIVVVDHNGNSLTWDDSLGSDNAFYAPGGTNPSGSGRAVYTLTAFDVEDFGTAVFWSVALASDNLSAI